MRIVNIARLIVAAVLATLLSFCAPEDEGLTDPCEADCNESALIGAPCASANDCALGNACILTFPGGYCVGECADSAVHGDACGEGGRCVVTAETPEPVCLAGCDAASPDSCERADTACYPLAGLSAGVCHLRCASDADCGGLGCDGAGVCRSLVSACEPRTNAGCDGAMTCFQSSVGFFCGLSGSSHVGEGCVADADCAAGALCAQGACQVRCDPELLSACGDFDSCMPVPGDPSQGYCLAR
jgi:hypothetical protein